MADLRNSGFYSNLERVIEHHMPNKAHPDAVRGLLRSKQIGEDEQKWSRIHDFLDDPANHDKGKVSREAVLKHVQENMPQVRVQERHESLPPLPDTARYFAMEHYDTSRISDEKTREQLDQLLRRNYRREGATPEELALLRQHADVMRVPEHHKTTYQRYTLPGGNNYREIILHLPPQHERIQMPEGWKVQFGPNTLKAPHSENHVLEPDESAVVDDQGVMRTINFATGGPRLHESDAIKHWQQTEADKAGYRDYQHEGHWGKMKNPLLHLRLNDREGPNGEKLLHMEELQSDWHQAGRKEGYHRQVPDIMADQQKLLQQPETPERNEHLAELRKEITFATELPTGGNAGVPEAPFSGNHWTKLGLKYLLHHAAQNGYDGVTWATGEQHTDRYGGTAKMLEPMRNFYGSIVNAKLPQDIPGIGWNPDTGMVLPHGGAPAFPMREESLRSMIGQEAYDALLKIPRDKDGYHHITNGQPIGAQHGGVGRWLKDYTKRWGGEIGHTHVGPKYEVGRKGGKWVVLDPDGQIVSAHASAKTAIEASKRRSRTSPKAHMVFHLPLTPQMKTAILSEGQPLWGERDALKKALVLIYMKKAKTFTSHRGKIRITR